MRSPAVTRRTCVRLVAALLAALATLSVLFAGSSGAAPLSQWDRDTLHGWRLSGIRSYRRSAADQGVTVVTTGHDRDVVVRGAADVTDPMSDSGWIHIGAPGSYDGSLVNAFQGHRSARSIMFSVTSPTGVVRTFRHRLGPGETYHNSFAAISPDGRWLVSGGWGVETGLRVLPDPAGPTTHNADLPLSQVIRFDRKVRDIQGCAFASSRVLYCSTNDPSTDLFPVPRQVLRVTLDRPLGAGDRVVRARVALVGEVPQEPGCLLPGETEGLSVHGSTLRLAVVPACLDRSEVYVFRRNPPPETA